MANAIFLVVCNQMIISERAWSPPLILANFAKNRPVGRNFSRASVFGSRLATGICELGRVYWGEKKGPVKGARKIQTMVQIKLVEPFSKFKFPATAHDDLSAADQMVQKAFEQINEVLSDQAVVEGLSLMFQADPLEAENRFSNLVGSSCRKVLGNVFENLPDYGRSLEVEGKRYRKVAPTVGQALTLFGPVTFSRSRYRPSNGQGECFIPAEHVLGLIEGDLTPAASGLSMVLLSNLTARESADIWNRFCGTAPAASTLVRLSAKAGQCLEMCSEEVLNDLREQEDIPVEAVTLHASIDGVMVRMNEKKEGDAVLEEGGWREASCGVVSLLDVDGNKLRSSLFGRLPEQGKLCLKAQVSKEVFHWLARKPDMKLVVSADGAKDNWAFAESLKPDVEVLDFWHAAEYLKLAADAAFGSDEAASTKWYKNKRHILRHDPDGVGKVIDALRHLLRKGKGRAEIERALGYFRNNRRRMNYFHIAKAGYPIGSGQVEAANKVLVTQRLKRSGQSWGRDGGQGVLSHRALLKSGRFDNAWKMLAPKLNRSKIKWEPVKYTANENRLPGVAA